MKDYLTGHGINEDTAKRFGLEGNNQQVIIPVRDGAGTLLFRKIRLLGYGKDPNVVKKFVHSPMGAEATLFNQSSVAEADTVYVVEGEPDVMRLSQDGVAAVCSTTGARTFKADWANLLSGKEVVLCYDNDEAGEKGLMKVLKHLPKAKVIRLPEEYKDVCEYLVDKPIKEFLGLTQYEGAKVLERLEDKFNKVKEKKTFEIYDGEEAYKEYERLQKNYGEGLSTGFYTLDRYFKFFPQQLYLLSAPTHHGKTIVALNICTRVAMQKHKVLFISLEQGVFVSSLVKKIVGSAYPASLSIMDSSEMLTVTQLTNAIQSQGKRFDLICVDHLHFLKKNGRGATEDIDEIILRLQNMAKKLEVPLIVIAHIRKLNANRPPELDDLRDSSSLSQVPSVVMFLYREKNEQSEKGYLANSGAFIIPKNRIQGKTGAFTFSLSDKNRLIFDGESDWLELDETPLDKIDQIM